jgi:acyl-CoA thioester hydrolase
MQDNDFKYFIEVRDYEIDMHQIVHHSVYAKYLELCRNSFVRSVGIDVHKYHEMGYDLVIVHLGQNFKLPLRPNDKFYVTAKISREGALKVIFNQEIRRASDDALILDAKVISLCLNLKTGRPCMPEMLDKSLKHISE